MEKILNIRTNTADKFGKIFAKNPVPGCKIIYSNYAPFDLNNAPLSSHPLGFSPILVSLPLSSDLTLAPICHPLHTSIYCASHRKSAPFTGLFTLATIHTALWNIFLTGRVGKLDGIRGAVVTILGPGGAAVTG